MNSAMIAKAISVANTSDAGTHKHGAIIIQGGKILTDSSNSLKGKSACGIFSY